MCVWVSTLPSSRKMSDTNSTVFGAMAAAALGLSLYNFYKASPKRSVVIGGPNYNISQNYGNIVYTAGQVWRPTGFSCYQLLYMRAH